MFGLHSDLDGGKWDESQTKPPEKKKTWEDYQQYGITRVTDKDDYIKYFLSTSSGEPAQALLYGAVRNPLKDVGHCYMKLAEKKPGLIIAGVAVEDDWVTMKPEYFDSFQEKTEEDKAAERKISAEATTVDMGIYGDLQSERWVKKGEPPRQKSKLGYEFYEVIRCEEDGNKQQHNLFLCASSGEQVKAKLTWTVRNAFHSITRGYFKIEKDIIKGIMVEDDWVEMK